MTATLVPLEKFRSYMRHNVTGVDDADLQDCLDEAEESFLLEVGRTFTVPTVDSTPETRTYRLDDPYLLRIDDLASTDDITVTVGTAELAETVAVAGIQFEPLNRRPNWPYTALRRIDGYRWLQNVYDRADVTITTKWWGWPAVPPLAPLAVKMMAKNLWHYRQTQFGGAVVGDFTVMVGSDPVIDGYVKKLRRSRTLTPRNIQLGYTI